MRCDNCQGPLSVHLRFIDGRPVMTPHVYTTSYGGVLCGTSCSMSYINRINTQQNVFNRDFGMHVQRKKHRTTETNQAS